ncbi:MAG: flagellar hook-basal body complex protein FliE [Planctomycetes bacterium GWF2_41_51]|nr:MAG: flagellar hook-basal body complex protein FliE [Planctomycetes bacterium GWF2_41_51]HBG26624.1 flagellar hook-basal body complex protein FliE [Phycisphaerales bacterium]
MVNFNPNVSSALPISAPGTAGKTNVKPDSGFADTIKAVEEQISKVDNLQQSSDISIQDLLAGKNEDITSVVSAVAKADMSFKLLVGVRNKLIEAYKQTMNMPI